MHDIAALIDRSPMNRGMTGADWLADPNNIAVEKGENVILFHARAPGVYEFHWLVVGEKGRKAIRDGRAALDEIFERPETRRAYGLVPVERREAALMARWIGGEYIRNIDTPHGECQLFVKERANS